MVECLEKDELKGEDSGVKQISTGDIYSETVHFTGHVQGVGFRYQALQVAREFSVTGMVRNLDDGRVELIAEGEEPEVQAFVEGLIDRMRKFIREADRHRSRGARCYSTFSIVH